MSSGLPAALKSADIARFAQRAGQLEKAKPAIAYWCNYWIVKQLISRGLHNADEDYTRYTTELMDKLEKIKTERSDDDTITDDVAAQVYVEQFALDTFQRAENAIRANKASRQTADTLAAAAAFLELRQIWEPLDPETSSRVKYAKYHALRIAKAIKAGEDPNATNPTPEPAPPQELPPNSYNVDPRSPDEISTPLAAYQPTVEIPDQTPAPHALTANQPQPPSIAPLGSPQTNQAAPAPPITLSTTGEVENFYQHPSARDVSPLLSPDQGRNGSIGGGYFPRAPGVYEQAAATNGRQEGMDLSSPPALPDTSSFPQPDLSSPPAPSASSPKTSRSLPPPMIDPGFAPGHSQHLGIASTQSPMYPQPSAPDGVPQPIAASVRQAAPAAFPLPHQQAQASNLVVDDEALAKAQKHARWAISALNFEDVNTAIKELRGALESLGAR